VYLPVIAATAWSQKVRDASDAQDIDKTSSDIRSGLLAFSQTLGAADLQLARTEGIVPVQLDSHAQAAVRRLQDRAKATNLNTTQHNCDLVSLLLTGSIREWEQLIVDSFQQGLSRELAEPTIKQQVRDGLIPVCV
jgi:hypothetical protein